MRILFFLPSLEAGGAQRVVLNLASAFAEKKCEVILVVAIPRGNLLNSVPDNVKLIHLNLRRSFLAISPLIKIIKSERPDIIYSRMNYANIIMAIASKLAFTKAKFIATIANTLTQEQFGNKIEEKGMFALEKLCYKRADIVIANSKDTYDDLIREKIVKPEKLKIIYNPVIDFNSMQVKIDEPILHPWLKNKTSLVLIAVGRLYHQKNFAFLIRCFAEVKKHSNAKLIIVGEGQLRAELEALVAEYNLQDDVSMPGFDNPYPYYKYADLFVLTSLWEGFGNVIVEALACGCPVVASNCPGGPKEILEWGKYGTLVDGYDEVQFAEAILAELERKRSKELLISRAGNFTIDKIVKQYEELFLTLRTCLK